MVGAYGGDVRQAWDIEEVQRPHRHQRRPRGGAASSALPSRRRSRWRHDQRRRRLQAAAAPGTIVTGETTAQRLMARFVARADRRARTERRAAPVSAWRVLRRKTTGRDHTQSPLVGRDGEAAAFAGPPTSCWPGAGSRCF
jgi:hypothetical protein